MAGRIEAVGEKATRFQRGDEVFGFGRGTLAEYVCTSEEHLTLKPANLSPEEAASVPVAACTALQALRKGQIREGTRVLIDGASGGVGTFSVMMAKSFGADVTAVCSTGNRENAHSMGADQVIDYTKDDFTKSGRCWDLIVLVNGQYSIFGYRRALNPKGVCIMVGSSRLRTMFEVVFLGRLVSKLGNRSFSLAGDGLNQVNLKTAAEFLETGKFRPFIERRCRLEEAPTALQYLGEGHAKGKVVLTISSE